MRKRLLFLFLLSLLGTSALVHANLPPVKPGLPGKKRGDIIAPMLDEQIAAWCDFNKQIVVTRTNILCAYIGDKPKVALKSAQSGHKKLAKSKPIPKDLTPNLYEMSEYDTA